MIAVAGDEQEKDPAKKRSTERRTGRPMVSDIDPHVLAVDALPDEVRLRGNADETEEVMSAGDQMSTRDMETGEEK